MTMWSTGPKMSERAAKAPGVSVTCGTSGGGGFTLIELMLVMALLVAIMALAGPRLNRFARGRAMDAEARMLVARLNAARDRAAVRAVVCRVEIDADGGGTRITQQQGGVFVDGEDSLARHTRLPQGLRLAIEPLDDTGANDGQATWIEIQPTGWATAARITLTDQAGDALYILARTPLERFVITTDATASVDTTHGEAL